MSAPPKLTVAERSQLLQHIQHRRALQRRIAEYLDTAQALRSELKTLPTIRELAQEHHVSYPVVRRILYGDPYKTSHPQDGKHEAA